MLESMLNYNTFQLSLGQEADNGADAYLLQPLDPFGNDHGPATTTNIPGEVYLSLHAPMLDGHPTSRAGCCGTLFHQLPIQSYQ